MSHRAESATGTSVVGNIVVAVSLTLVAAVAGGCNFSPMGLGNMSSCGSSCSNPGFITPYSVWMLRGDTVRFNVCNDYSRCGLGNDTGNVVAEWSVPDSSVVSISHGSAALRVASATNVLVRAIAPGRATLSVTFPGSGTYQKPIVNVADSSVISAIELPLVYSTSSAAYMDTLRVGGQVTFDVSLKDVGGRYYRAWPTASLVTDTAVLKLTRQVGTYDQRAQMRVTAVRPGKAALQVRFLGVTATRHVTVIP